MKLVLLVLNLNVSNVKTIWIFTMMVKILGVFDMPLLVNNTIYLYLLRYSYMTRILINIILGCIAFFCLLVVVMFCSLIFSSFR